MGRISIVVFVVISFTIIIGVGAYLTLGRKAKFEVSSLTLSKTVAKVGEEVTVSVEVRNVGGASGTYRAVLVINGEKVQEREVRLAPGEVRMVTFVVVGNTNGTYTIEVDKLTKSLKVLTPATFRLSNLAVSPSEPEVGQPILISVTVKNVGEVEGTYILKLKINDATESSRDVTLAGGAVETVSFKVTIPATGSYSIDVNGLKSTLTVLKPLPGLFSVVEPEPECISITTTPYFAWQSSKNADKYVLEIATSPQFGDAVVYRRELGSDVREHRVDAPLKSLRKYYYRVTAVNERGGTVASNTPNWFTTCLHLPDTVASLAVSPDGTKAVVTYLSKKNVVAVVSLTDPPRVVANLTLPKAARDVAITYDGEYAVIAGPPGYVLDLDTLSIREIVYNIPVKSWGIVASKVVAAPNRNVAYLVNDLLGASPIVSVLDVASARVTDYVRVYEITSLMTTPVDPYDISKDGRYLYVGYFTGIQWENGTITGFIEKIDLQAKALVFRVSSSTWTSGPWSMKLALDGKYGLVSVQKGSSGSIQWWNIDGGKIEGELKYAASGRGYKEMAVTPDGSKLVVLDTSKVGIISVVNRTVVEEHYCYRGPVRVVVSSDGKFALVGGYSRLGILFLEG